jgi:hypothetical protein
MSKMGDLYLDLLELGSVKVREIEDKYLQLVLDKKSYPTAKLLLYREYKTSVEAIDFIISKAKTHGISDWLAKLEVEDAYGIGE